MTKQLLTPEQLQHIREHIKLNVSVRYLEKRHLYDTWYLKTKLSEIVDCKELIYTNASFDVKINNKLYNISHLRATLINNRSYIDYNNQGLTDSARWKLNEAIGGIFADEYKKLDNHKIELYTMLVRNFKEEYRYLQKQMKDTQNFLKEYNIKDELNEKI